MAGFVDKLRESAERTGSIACFGNDPVLGEGKVHLPGSFSEAVSPYYSAIFEEARKRGEFPSAFKPNHGFFERHNKPRERQYDGYLALDVIMSLCEKERVPTIFDEKRGDIKKSSENYAVAAFDGWRADSVTTHAYMGIDSMAPFFERGGTYMMCRTSNPSAVDMQDLAVMGIFKTVTDDKGNKTKELVEFDSPMEMFMCVADLAVKWSKDPKYAGNVGVVVGATYPAELEQVAKYFVQHSAEVPILVPGIGAQGGDEHECMERLAAAGYDHRLARLSSSSGLNFAYAKKGLPADQWAVASVDALADMNRKINLQHYLKKA